MKNLIDRFRTVCIIAPLVLLCLLYRSSMLFLAFIAMAQNWLEFMEMSASPPGKNGYGQYFEALLVGALPCLSLILDWPPNKGIYLYALPALTPAALQHPSLLKTVLWRILGLVSFVLPIHMCIILHRRNVSCFFLFWHILGRNCCLTHHSIIDLGYRHIRSRVRQIVWSP